MEHLIPHDLDLATAKKVADRAFEEYKKRLASYDPQMRWIDDRRAEVSFSAMAMTLKGSLEITKDQIKFELEVPFLLRPFKKKAIDIIDREVKLWIGKAKAGEI